MAMQGRSRSAEQVRDKSGLGPHEIACVGVLNCKQVMGQRCVV